MNTLLSSRFVVWANFSNGFNAKAAVAVSGIISVLKNPQNLLIKTPKSPINITEITS